MPAVTPPAPIMKEPEDGMRLVRIPNEHLIRAEAIAEASKVLKSQDIIRMAVEKGLSLVAEIFTDPAAESKEEGAKP